MEVKDERVAKYIVFILICRLHKIVYKIRFISSFSEFIERVLPEQFSLLVLHAVSVFGDWNCPHFFQVFHHLQFFRGRDFRFFKRCIAYILELFWLIKHIIIGIWNFIFFECLSDPDQILKILVSEVDILSDDGSKKHEAEFGLFLRIGLFFLIDSQVIHKGEVNINKMFGWF